MSKETYYDILQVSPLSSLSAIKKSYHKLVRIHHPDKHPNNPEASETFKKINEAYEVLSDTFKRKEFDRQLKKEKEAEKIKKSQTKPMYEAFSSHQPFSTAETQTSVTSVLFEQPPQPATQKTKEQFCGKLPISLEQGFKGCKKHIKLKLKGLTPKDNFLANIPAGVKDSQKIKLTGLTNKAKKMKNLYITIHYKDHTIFKKDKFNIELDLPISLTKAVLGGSVETPTLRGQRVSFPLSPGVHSGHIIRLKNMGFPIDSKSQKHGDMFLKILIDIPSDLSEDEIAWIRTLGKKQKKYPAVAEFKIKAQSLLKNKKQKK